METASPAGAPSLTEDSDELARAYESVSAGRQFQSGKKLARDLAIGRGQRVLDVGCGTGLLAEHIADLVGPDGYVLGTDPLPLRIGLAQARSRANLEFRVGNAYDLAVLPAGGFDVVCLNAVFHWLPEKSGPLREFARVLKAGGRLGITSRVKGDRSRIGGQMAVALARPPFDAYRRPPGGLIYHVDEREMRDLFGVAGFAVDSIDMHDTRQVHATPEAALGYSEASSFGNLLGHLPLALRAGARAAIGRELAALAAPDGTVSQDGRRLVAIGIRSAP